VDEKFWYLKKCDLFERLSRDEVQGLEARSQSRKYPRSSLVYLPADASDSVFLLATGRVKIYHLTADGKQAVLAIIDPGELFGELAVFIPHAREEFAETMESSVIVRIPRAEVQRLIEKHPTVSFEIIKLMGLRRQRADRRLKALLFRSNRDRLVYLLLELVEKYGLATPQGVRLDIKLSHQDLASIIGSTRETVTVVLGELEAEGYLRRVRRQTFLPDIERLAESVSAETPQVQGKPPVTKMRH
jgi:CRP-like cAMP-binding protein